VKIKLILFILTIVSVASVSLLGLYVFFLSPLISPLSIFMPKPSSFYPRLEAKVNPPQINNLDNESLLVSLKNIPHYLAYNFGSGKIYAAKGVNDHVSPASLTKLMTVQVALDLISPDQLVTASSISVNKEPTILGLKAGEQLAASDLIRASIATSANDAAATLAQGVSHIFQISLDDFISLMNHKAKLLQMTNTQFANPEGYDDENQFSTLADLSKLANNVIANYPKIITSAASNNEDIQKTPIHDHYYLPNWNTLLDIYPGVNGLKIAYTEKAGHSGIVTAKREGQLIVAILTGADSILERDLGVAALLDAGFLAENIAPVNIIKRDLQPRYQEWADLSAKIRKAKDQTNK